MSVDCDPNSKVLLGVWDCQGYLLGKDDDRVRSLILSVDITCSRLNRANPAP
jgi:hypothetical protein